MDRITGPYVATLSPGSRRGWQDLNYPGTPNGTGFNAQYENGSQEELLAFIEGTGQTPNAGSTTQIFQAVAQLAASGYSPFNGLSGGSTFTLTAAEGGLIYVNANAGSVTLNLPAAVGGNGAIATTAQKNAIRYTFVRGDQNTANTVTIVPNGSDYCFFGGQAASSVTMAPLTVTQMVSDATSVWQTWQTSQSTLPQWTEWTSHGTYSFVVPAGKTQARGTLTGSGGGGGGTKTTGDAGVSGAGAETDVFTFPTTPGSTLTIVVGQGGTAGASGTTPTAGGGGTITSIYNGATLICEIAGGSGGAASAAAGVVTTGVGSGEGTGTAGSGVTMVSRNAASGSGPAITVGGGGVLNAQGGSPLAVGLAAISTSTPPQPIAAGHGGWGGINGGAGSAGADGYVRIEV